jgi:hypothetical protein
MAGEYGPKLDRNLALREALRRNKRSKNPECVDIDNELHFPGHKWMPSEDAKGVVGELVK